MTISDAVVVDPIKHRWKAVGHQPGCVERRGNGTENWVGIREENLKGQYDLYIVVKIKLLHGNTLSNFRSKLVSGLLRSRYQHPDIACEAVWDDQFEPLVRYTSPSNAAVALSWANDTVALHYGSQQTAFNVRRQIVSSRQSWNGPSRSATIHAIANTTDEEAELPAGTFVELLFHMNHIFWDGISARLFVGDLLRSLGEDLSCAQYVWGREISNLSVPVLDALKLEPTGLGGEFQASLDEFLASLFKFESSHALEIGVEPGLPNTTLLKLTAEECRQIMRGIKSRLGPQATITHLGQAATLMALLETNPPAKNALVDQEVIMPLPVNGRRYLRDSMSENRYGSCQACAVVEFHQLHRFLVNKNDQTAIMESMIQAMEITKTYYDYWLSKPFLLALGLSKDNFISAHLATNKSIPNGKAVPIFVSDGVNDSYLPSTVSSSDDTPLLSVEDTIFLTDSYQPGVLVRMESWQGATTLSLSFCDGSFSTKQADSFLRCMKKFMMVFA